MFTPIPAAIGGVLIGASAALLVVLNGRVAGISGILGGLIAPKRDDLVWRLAFVFGMVAAPVALAMFGVANPTIDLTSSPKLLIAGGLLVGYGTRLGGGCTSGHGVCGIARLSRRSFAATAIFIVSAAVTVLVRRHLLGG